MEALVWRLEETGLVVKLAKCEFVQASVQYLGYVVDHGQVSPPQAKVEAIKNFKAPYCRRALQRFLGMIGYYRHFIRGYSTVFPPLTVLLRKGTKWAWSAVCEQAFDTVKVLLCNSPILRAPDFTRPFVLPVDASCVGADGCVVAGGRGRGGAPCCFLLEEAFACTEKLLRDRIGVVGHLVGPCYIVVYVVGIELG